MKRIDRMREAWKSYHGDERKIALRVANRIEEGSLGLKCHFPSCVICHAIFPQLGKGRCPCSQLGHKYVERVAKKLIDEVLK